jgi:hypothetical protein
MSVKVKFCKIVDPVSGVDIDDCVSDDDTICGDVSTEASMPQLNTLSRSGSGSASGSESESDYDGEAGPSWGCKILPKKNSDGQSLSSKSAQPVCRRFYSTDCNDVDRRLSSNTDDDFERRSLPSNFVTSSMEESSLNAADPAGTTSSGLKKLRPSESAKDGSKSSLSSHSESSANAPASDLSWIDRTPSESSLQLPFCPPVRVDYEDFPRAFQPPKAPTLTESKRTTPPKVESESKVPEKCLERDSLDKNTTPTSSVSIVDENFDENVDDELIYEEISTPSSPERSRRSMAAPDREFSIIPVEKFSDFSRAIPSPVFPLPSSSSPTFVSCREIVFEVPPEFSDDDTKKSHYVEIIIQISPPLAFSSPILPPPPSFSTTVTRPNLPHRSCAVSRNSQPHNGKIRDSSIRSSMRDSGLADISPHVCRRRPNHLSSSQSFINSASPTSGLSSDEIGASLTGLATTPIQNSRLNLSLRSGCCFLTRPPRSGKKCLPFNLLNKRAKILRRERSQSLDDSVMLQSCRPNTGLENDGAISCLDLPVSSLSTDIFEDDEEPQERDSSYPGALYAHWWLSAPVRKL